MSPLKWSLFLMATIVHCGGDILPPIQFIDDFAVQNNVFSITFYLPKWANKREILLHKRSSHYLETAQIFPTAYLLQDNNLDVNATDFFHEDLHLFILDPRSLQESVNLFKTLFNQRSRRSNEIWLLDISVIESIENAIDLIADLKLDLDDDLICFQIFNENNDNNTVVNLWDIYRIKEDFPISKIVLGSWTFSSGLRLIQPEKWVRRKDLQGAHFRVLTMPTAPYITDMIPIGNGTFRMEGMFAEVFFALEETLNFTYTLRQPPDKNWGSLQSDGTWNGMVRELQDKRADIAPADFTVTIARSQVITFAQPITRIHHQLFIKNPTGSFNFTAYIEPLHYLSWIFVVLLILLGPLVLFYIAQHGKVKDPDFTLSNSWGLQYSNTLKLGWSDTPFKIATRCAFISLVLAGNMIYNHWEGMLISYLSTRVIVLPFNSIKGLLDFSTFRIALNPGTSFEDAFKLSTDEVWQEAWNERIKMHLDEYRPYRGQTLPLITNDFSTALYDNFYSASSHKAYADCEIIDIPAKYDFKPYAYGFQKDSPLLGLFNFYLKEMREKGALKQILNKYTAGPQICPDYSGKAIGFDNCFTAFAVLLGGLVLGFVLMIFEWLFKLCGFDNNSEFGDKKVRHYDQERRNPELEVAMRLLQEKDEQISWLKAENKAMSAAMMKYQGSTLKFKKQAKIMVDLDRALHRDVKTYHSHR